MKKISAFILIAVMVTAMFIPVSAHSGNGSLGNVPKTAKVPAIDGVKDDVFDQGLYVPVRNPHDSTPDGGLGGDGDAWLLWDDNFMHVFMKVDVKSFFHPDDFEDSRLRQKPLSRLLRPAM